MAQYLLCPACRDRDALVLTKADRANGFKERRVEIAKAKKPKDLTSTMTTHTPSGHIEITRETVLEMRCDSCDETIPEGTLCLAVTHWRREEPPRWETEYEQA